MVEANFMSVDDPSSYKSSRNQNELTFNDRANKRMFCTRLTIFLKLIDFIVINLIYSIIKQTFAELSHEFKSFSCPEIFDSENFRCGINVQDKTPLFSAKLILKPNEIQVEPAKAMTYHLINQIVELIMNSVYDIKRFQNDEFFKVFTEPGVLCQSNLANVEFLIQNDKELLAMKNSVFESIVDAYQRVDSYIGSFKLIQENYKLDMQTDKEALRTESNLDKLISYCKRYTSEINEIENLPSLQDLGLFQLDQSSFKEQIIPTCKELLTILENLLPR